MMAFTSVDTVFIAFLGTSLLLCLVMGRVWALALYIASFVIAGILSVVPFSIPPTQQLFGYGVLTVLAGWAIKKRPLHGLHARDIGRFYQAWIWALAVAGTIVINASRFYNFNTTPGGFIASVFTSQLARSLWLSLPLLVLISMKRKVQHAPSAV